MARRRICHWALARLAGRPLRVADRVYGLMQSGRMHEAYVVRVLETMHAPVVELYFHPDERAARRGLGPNPTDLATLLSPAVRDVIRRRGLDLSSFASLDYDVLEELIIRKDTDKHGSHG